MLSMQASAGRIVLKKPHEAKLTHLTFPQSYKRRIKCVTGLQRAIALALEGLVANCQLIQDWLLTIDSAYQQSLLSSQDEMDSLT